MSEAKHAERAAATLRYQPYPAYKDSGVEWLGEIPAHWRALALKRIGDLQAGAGFPDDEQGIQDEETPFFKVGDMGAPGNEREMLVHQHSVSRATARRLRAHVFPAGTIVFAKVGAALLLNRRRLIARPSCIDNNMMGFMPDDCDTTWALYWLTGLDMGRLANPGAVPSVNEGQMRETPAAVPPLGEQRAIAAFLDRETARIDALVAKKERLIELLQERRTALITRAVTKGLDPTVPMKDSGVEWLGEIPAGWEVKKWRYCCRVTEGQVAPDDDRFRERILIAPNHIESGTGRILYTETADEQGAISGKYLVAPGDIIYSKIRPALNKVCIAGGDWLCSADMYPVAITEKRLQARFLLYFMLSEPFVRLMVDESMRVAMPKINREKLATCPLVIADPDEQRAIAAFLDRETARIDALVAKVREAIERLKELRTALISAAVTGKIDVREEVAA